jgi:D-lactate dehydrogenase
MKIALINVPKEEQNIYTESLGENEIVFKEGEIKNYIDEIKDIEVLSVFVDVKVSKDDIDNLPNLKLIAARSTGYDNIDFKYAESRGIKVVNVPTYGSRTVAEFTFALLLSVSRKAFSAYDRLRISGDTDVDHYEGFDLYEKTIGIVGTGNIGKNVARIAKGFGMNVLLFDLEPDQEFAKEVKGEYINLDDLVKESDVVTLHVPYNDNTHHLVNTELLSKFKKGSYIINTSRGGIIDTESLVEHIQNGTIAGAGLDVVEGEEDFKDEISLLLKEENDIEKFRDVISAHKLLNMDNVVLTPHIAFNTKEAKKEILNKTIENINTFINSY